MCIFKRKKVEIPVFPGAIPSPPDSRDIRIASVQAQIELRDLPEEFIIPYKLRISYQNGFPHCVGYAGATIKEEKERREQTPIDFDGDWLYKECKKIDGYNGDGTFPRVMMKVLKEKGLKPLNGSEADAGRYRIGGFSLVENTEVGLKNAIRMNGAVATLFRGSNPGWQTAYVRPPKSGEIIWGHEVALIGWNKNYIIGQNSWGEGWGDKGLFYLPLDYKPDETWAILVDLPNDFVQIIKPSHIFSNDLQLGDNGEEVVWLQKCLKYLGIFPQVIDCTGNFGDITLSAVQLFQKTYGIVPTAGYVGKLTRAKLNELFV